MQPSILILARHFPPLISGGARRPYLLALALQALGCDVFVIAPRLPDGVKGLGVEHPHPDPPGGFPARRGLRDIARDHLLWPDPDIRWARRAAKAAVGSGFQADWLFTTSPPESLHSVAPGLKRALGVRWAADFRDEWLTRPFRKVRRGPLRRPLERLLARHMLKSADLVTCVDAVVARELEGLSRRPPALLEQFAAPAPASARLDGEGPHLVYSGSFSLSDPNCAIQPTLLAFTAAFAQRPSLRLHLVGRLSPAEVAAVEDCPALAAIIVHGPRPYDETRAMQAAADALLVSAAPDATAVPGKVYEYRTVGAPIVAIGEGPWRVIGGYESGNPVDRFLALKAGADRLARQPGPVQTPEGAARHLLGLMRSAGAALPDR